MIRDHHLHIWYAVLMVANQLNSNFDQASFNLMHHHRAAASQHVVLVGCGSIQVS